MKACHSISTLYNQINLTINVLHLYLGQVAQNCISNTECKMTYTARMNYLYHKGT
jgi:hypothetical protein